MGLEAPGTHWGELLVRMGLAAGIGVLFGINRQLHHKPIGVRTLSLVALGSCVLTLAITQRALETGSSSADASRVAQGIVSGIGFLGAGVIMRGADKYQVHNLTTAATIWVSAALGIVCAIAAWQLVFLGTGFALFVLVIGEPIERAIRRKRRQRRSMLPPRQSAHPRHSGQSRNEPPQRR